MIIFVNGAFGVGKSTVAQSLRRRLRGTITFDPECVGIALQRTSTLVPFRGRNTGDFQDMPFWRTLTIAGIRLASLASDRVIVPMTFSNKKYFDEIVGKAKTFEDVRCFCLIAPWEVVERRLRDRGVDPETVAGAWVFRRAAECCLAHDRGDFGEKTQTEERSVDCIVASLVSRIENRVLEHLRSPL